MQNYMTHTAFSENPFVFRSEDSILHDRDLGIAGDKVSVLTPPLGACMLKGIQNCPLSGTGVTLEVRIDGERIAGREWTWLPNSIRRSGKVRNWQADTLTLIPPGENGCLLWMQFKNLSEHAVTVPVQVVVSGSVKRHEKWVFTIPEAGGNHFAAASAISVPGGTMLRLIGSAGDVEGGAITEKDPMCLVTCSLPDMQWFAGGEILETTRTVAAGETCDVFLSLHLGEQTTVLEEEASRFLRNPTAVIENAFSWLSAETDRVLTRMPHFSSDNPALTALYYRSLVTYILNRWENPQFVIQPFYSTGSINGGCMCSYLWDYSGSIMLHPLIDPETNKKMIRMYLSADLCTSYAITPLDGSPTGPWYHINQEKIIGMIYYHVLHTGDTDFLQETVEGRTIAEWAVFHAMVGDDPQKPVALLDYGKAGDSHLELRRKYVYHGIMPDLNARRYQNYCRAYVITELAGKAQPMLLERAEGLKKLLPELWDNEDGWYDFIREGKREKRYTVQMFKFLDSGIIDDSTRDKLIVHLNEREFLSRYGLHSMSKLDPAYDQIDIDNGGGGICPQFTMQIVLQLYHTGYDTLASDILRRVLWWGTRLPYMGDSYAANMLFDREDTPLQADISSASCAQTILFGVCGIDVQADRTIKICPPKEFPAERICVKDMRLLGKCFSLCIDKGSFWVDYDEKHMTGVLGDTIII